MHRMRHPHVLDPRTRPLGQSRRALQLRECHILKCGSMSRVKTSGSGFSCVRSHSAPSRARRALAVPTLARASGRSLLEFTSNRLGSKGSFHGFSHSTNRR